MKSVAMLPLTKGTFEFFSSTVLIGVSRAETVPTEIERDDLVKFVLYGESFRTLVSVVISRLTEVAEARPWRIQRVSL